MTLAEILKDSNYKITLKEIIDHLVCRLCGLSKEKIKIEEGEEIIDN